MNTITENSTVYFMDQWKFTVSPIFILSVYSSNILLVLPLNIYVIVLLFPRRCVIEPSDIFSLNQAVVETFFMFLAPFHGLCSLSLHLCLFKPLGFLLATSMASRCTLQCFVCLERYLAVVHPVTFLRYKPARYRVACSVLTWIFSFAIGFTGMFTYPTLPYNVFAFMLALVLLIDMFCCASILKRLKHPGPRDMESDAGESNAAKKKAFQVVSINMLMFLIQKILTTIAFIIEQSLSEYAFGLPVMTGLAVNTVTGLFQPLYVLHRSGKLLSIQNACFPTPSSTLCFRSVPKIL
ncbi:G-protein coupled receptor 35-like [Astyanax mexicanus]|uniref:G-protein coupled receptor 35-like n=1 Tax=Astyanax mexicanus TaxID=7994 RepID=A0A8T2M149_ASTMX|nr:G-protein coupled receptor 35-like [Astyanax mexicanus]